MATGRIGVTPTLRTRWSKAPAGGTTSLSGLDDNSVSLVYDVGYEGVYRNGVLLSRGNDYTATDGTTVTLIDATIAGDIIEIFANELIPLSDAISKGQYTAKGALLSATAASTPGVLTVGSNDQVLTADSSTSTGLKWATPSSGGMTLLSTTTLSGSSTTISSISGSYKNLYVEVENISSSAGNQIFCNPNTTTGKIIGILSTTTASAGSGFTGYRYVGDDNINMTYNIKTAGNTVNFWSFNFYNYASSATRKTFDMLGGYVTGSGTEFAGFTGYFNDNTAISSLKFTPDAGTWSGGTVRIYGVN